ncbi:MAG: hypothetical protein KAI24_00195 [Planctomycetes bacterium]|nr:hypothetical protein [Planctomycetota bacterium]
MTRVGLAAVAAWLMLTASGLVAQSDRERKEIERMVFRAFPEADAFSSISRDLDLKMRARIEARLPFKVHFDELGKHELLVAFRGRRPVGIVSRRTEEAEWGLTEIAWHMTLDRRIVGFRYLRGRNRSIKSLERGRLATDLEGADFGDITKLLTRNQVRRDHDSSAARLERTTLRSAAKALAVVDSVWLRDVDVLHDRATGFDLFPAAARFTSRTSSVELDQAGERQQLELKVLYAYDSSNVFLGCVAWTKGERGIEQHELRWALDRRLSVRSLKPVHEHRDVEVRKACSQLQGRPLTEPSDDSALAPLARCLGVALPELQNRRAHK